MTNSKKIFAVLGGKWYDKVNGNTYHNAKIVDVETKDVFYSGFHYGYGTQYMETAKEEVETLLGINPEQYEVINIGETYLTKKEVKNGWF